MMNRERGIPTSKSAIGFVPVGILVFFGVQIFIQGFRGRKIQDWIGNTAFAATFCLFLKKNINVMYVVGNRRDNIM